MKKDLWVDNNILTIRWMLNADKVSVTDLFKLHGDFQKEIQDTLSKDFEDKELISIADPNSYRPYPAYKSFCKMNEFVWRYGSLMLPDPTIGSAHCLIFEYSGKIEDKIMAKKHPGFKAVQNKIAKQEGVSKDAAGAILASSSRNASVKAKKSNPKLKKVK